jgi:hypothetical protein
VLQVRLVVLLVIAKVILLKLHVEPADLEAPSVLERDGREAGTELGDKVLLAHLIPAHLERLGVARDNEVVEAHAVADVLPELGSKAVEVGAVVVVVPAPRDVIVKDFHVNGNTITVKVQAIAVSKVNGLLGKLDPLACVFLILLVIQSAVVNANMEKETE